MDFLLGSKDQISLQCTLTLYLFHISVISFEIYWSAQKKKQTEKADLAKESLCLYVELPEDYWDQTNQKLTGTFKYIGFFKKQQQKKIIVQPSRSVKWSNLVTASKGEFKITKEWHWSDTEQSSKTIII